jgi:hypothetical protein
MTANDPFGITNSCILLITSLRPVDLAGTELAVIAFHDGRVTLLDTGARKSVARVDGPLRTSPAACTEKSDSAILVVESIENWRLADSN